MLRTSGFCYLVSELQAAGAIDSIHDITVGYPAGLIQDESDLADGKMPKEGFCCLQIIVFLLAESLSSLFHQAVSD